MRRAARCAGSTRYPDCVRPSRQRGSSNAVVRGQITIFSRASGVALIAALALSVLAPLRAQVQPASLNITPVYEGWVANPDGSAELMFGYLNREWDGQVTIPLGPGNTMDPGGPDLGQPTNFFPRRNRFVFQVHVPKDFGAKEI